MRKGEKGIFVAMGLSVLVLIGVKAYMASQDEEPDPGIPYYSTADKELTNVAARIMKEGDCKGCHTLWGSKDIVQAFMKSVPAPPLDGMGYFRDEEWLFSYFSAEDPQEILPSRLKAQYRHPSSAHLPESDRRALARYIASLKVEDWYLEETKKRRFEKLTGKDYSSESE